MTSVDSALDALELELRRLPGIVGIGFSDEDGVVVVHILADESVLRTGELRRLVTQQARAYLDRPLVIEIEDVEAPAPAVEHGRVRLEAVVVDAFSKALDVHVAFGSRRAVGRGEAGSPRDAAATTMLALDRLGAYLPFRVDAATASLRTGPDHAVVVVLDHAEGGPKLYGVARASTSEEAAARATLHALNRYLSRESAFVPR